MKLHNLIPWLVSCRISWSPLVSQISWLPVFHRVWTSQRRESGWGGSTIVDQRTSSCTITDLLHPWWSIWNYLHHYLSEERRWFTLYITELSNAVVIINHGLNQLDCVTESVVDCVLHSGESRQQQWINISSSTDRQSTVAATVELHNLTRHGWIRKKEGL